MRLVRAAWPALILSCGAALVLAACGDTKSSGVNGTNGSGANGSGANGSGANGSGANGTGANGPDLGSLGGESDGSDVTDPGSDTCAGELIEAKYIPLDMYIMLDVSGSMMAATDGDPNTTKWRAVSAALTAFIEDEASAGIGVGLQLFPLQRPEAPEECTTNQQCGEFGPCLLKICSGGTTVRYCTGNNQCGFQGPCQTFGVCANDQRYVCTFIGELCADDLGECIPTAHQCLAPEDCRPESYADPAAAIAELPGAAAGLLSTIMGAKPTGETPSGPALAGAIQQATEWASAHPDHRVVAVLATDGLPSLEQNADSCRAITLQSQIDAVSAIAAMGLAGTPSISTFAIGVFGSDEVGGDQVLNDIAAAGGTETAFIVDSKNDVQEQFRDALNQIRGTQLSCELVVPEADAGKTVDFNQVNVSFDDGGGPSDLFYVEEKAGCDTKTGGWYYDTAPPGIPERIIVCPATCDAFGAADMGSVQIKLGCATRKPVK